MKTILLLVFFCPLVLWAQGVKITPEDIARKQSFLLLHDGSVVRGQIIRKDNSGVTVRKTDGDMTYIEIDQLLGIMPIRPRPVSLAPRTSLYSTFVLKDSSRIEGSFVKRDSTMITVRKRNGLLTYFEPELVVRIDSVWMEPRGATDSNRVFSNRFSPWLLVGETAFNPEKGQVYYRNKWLFQNEFHYGITRFWSIGARLTTPIPSQYQTGFFTNIDNGMRTPRLSSKFSVPIGRKVRVGLSVAYQPLTSAESYRRGALTLQALGSFGNSQRNITLGYGLVNWGNQRVYQPQDVWSSAYPTPFTTEHIPNQSFLTLGIMQKVRPGLTLLSDNQINLGQGSSFSGNGQRATLSFAFRLDRKRHAFDLGLYSLIYRSNYLHDGKIILFYPYIGYNLIFGTK
jgi:hypothetical protein